MKYKLFEFIILKDALLDQLVAEKLMNPKKEHENELKLFGYIQSLDEKTLSTISYTSVFKKMSPNSKYTEGYQRHIMVQLQKIYEQCMYDLGKSIDSLALAKIYREKKLTKNYNALLNEISIELSQPKYDEANFLKNIELYNEKINQGIFLNKITHEQIKSFTIQIDEQLDIYYIIQKLKNLLSILNLDKSYDTDQFDYYPQLTKIINSNQMDDIPLVYLYKHSYKLQVMSDGASYDIVKNILYNDYNEIGIKEKKDLSALLSNFCIKKINTQEFKYYMELMGLYKFNIQHNIVLENNLIVNSTFRNYIQIALRCDEIVWARTFIKEYQKYLKPIEQESTVSICQALISFKEKKYNNTIKELTQVNFHDYQLDILARLLLSRAYYELDELETLGYLVDSFKKYLQRNKKIDPRLIIPCKNFLKNLSILMNINPRDALKLGKLKISVQEQSQLAEKQWIIEKIEEL